MSILGVAVLNEMDTTRDGHPMNMYIKIPNEILLSIKDGGHQVMYGIIFTLSQKNGCCTASNKYLKSILGISERAIQDRLKWLSDNGFIEIELNHGKGRTITIRDTPEVDRTPEVDPTPEVDRTPPPKLTAPPPEVDRTPHYIYRDNNDIIDNTKSHCDIETAEQYFNDWWKFYIANRIHTPAGVKANARKSYMRIISKKQATHETLAKETQRVLALYKQAGTYTPHASTFLNQERWTQQADEFSLGATPKKPKSQMTAQQKSDLFRESLDAMPDNQYSQ